MNFIDIFGGFALMIAAATLLVAFILLCRKLL